MLARLRKAPDSPQADSILYQLAMHALAAGNYAEAVERLETLQKQFPLSPLYADSEYHLGLALQAAGQYEKAWLPLRGSLSRERNPLRRAILQAALGEVYEARKDPFAALESYSEALAGPPELPARDRLLARLRALSEKDVAFYQLGMAADRFAQTSVGPYLRLALARRAAAEDRPQTALAAARRFISEYPDHPELPAAREIESELQEQLAVNRGRIGVLLPLSGPAAGAGERVYQGIQLALRNTLEEYPKLQIQLAVRDTHSTAQAPGNASTAVTELIEKEKAVALIGPFLTIATEAAAQVAERLKTPLITPFAIRMQMSDRNAWVFRNSLTNRLQSQGIAVYAMQELGIRQFAVLYPDDRDGRESADFFAESVRNLGGRVVKLVSFPPDANDFGPQMRALGGMDDTQLRRRKHALGLGKNDPYRLPLPYEGLFIPAYYDKAVLIAPQVPFFNMQGIRLLGGHGWNSPDLLKYGERYVEGAVFVDGFFAGSEEPRVVRFVTEYQQLFGRKPDIFGALGYDAGRIIFNGLAQGAKTRKAMRTYLASLHGFQGIMGLTDMGSDHDAQRQLFVLTVRKRKIEHLQMVTPHRALRGPLTSGDPNTSPARAESRAVPTEKLDTH